MFLDWTASCQPTCSVPFPRRWKEYEEQQEDSRNEITLIPERQVYNCETAIENSREKVLAGRKAEMEEMMNHHVFDEVPKS